MLQTIAPIFYGSMPNLGLYSVPDGPVENPGDLLPMGKIDEARAAFEEMAEYAIKDMVYVGSEMYEKAGADGINFDTTAAAGDAEFYAALKAAEILHEKYPDMGIEMGMSGEFISWGCTVRSNMTVCVWPGFIPQDQVKVAQQGGCYDFWTGH